MRFSFFYYSKIESLSYKFFELCRMFYSLLAWLLRGNYFKFEHEKLLYFYFFKTNETVLWMKFVYFYFLSEWKKRRTVCFVISEKLKFWILWNLYFLMKLNRERKIRCQRMDCFNNIWKVKGLKFIFFMNFNSEWKVRWPRVVCPVGNASWERSASSAKRRSRTGPSLEKLWQFFSRKY